MNGALQSLVVGGYAMTAVLYLVTWWNPAGGLRNDMLQWVSFERLCLAEFLSVHAATLLGGLVFAAQDGQANEHWDAIFWSVAAFYGLMAIGAYFMHRSHRALFSFYLLLVLRASQLVLYRHPDPDVMRAEVLKNLLMFVPMMILIAIVTMSDGFGASWQERFLKSDSPWQRVVRGRPLLVVVAYYLLWAYVELRWPERITN